MGKQKAKGLNPPQRYADGDRTKAPKAETEKAIRMTVITQRVKFFGAPNADAANDDRYGYPLGRLWLQKIISQEQHEAGKEFDRRVRRADRTIPERPSPTCQNIGWGRLVANPLLPDDCAHLADKVDHGPPEDEEKRQTRARERYRDMRREIEELERTEGAPFHYLGVWELLERTCVLDLEIAQSVHNIGRLRAGLNVLARLFQK